jgi:hypothetical protein
VAHADEPVLAVARVVSSGAWVEPAHLPGEALAQAFTYAVVIDARGRRRTIPRGDVLWRVEDHADVGRAAAVLGVPLLSASVLAIRTWRLGAVRLDVRDMVELGRLLAGT